MLATSVAAGTRRSQRANASIDRGPIGEDVGVVPLARREGGDVGE